MLNKDATSIAVQKQYKEQHAKQEQLYSRHIFFDNKINYKYMFRNTREQQTEFGISGIESFWTFQIGMKLKNDEQN